MIRNIFFKTRLTLTIAMSKLLIKVCRLLRLGGTSLPGKVANKMFPGILKILAGNVRIIMVTGTNGKTTTSRIIAQILNENGISFFTNKSGANLLSGITTAFIEAARLNGRPAKDTALIEIDEAAFNKAADLVSPSVLVVTNFFRDQLDRYGELYSTLKSVRSGIGKTSGTVLVLNADDSLCASLGASNKSIYYGVSPEAYKESVENSNTDAMFCLYCKSRYEYSYHTYGHLGGFKCPNCGYERPTPHIECTRTERLADSYSEVGISISGKTIRAKINLPGVYNIYNALAAAACGYALGLPEEKTVAALQSFECGFGRMETIHASDKYIKLILVKNPTGFSQVINYLSTEKNEFLLAFAINDKLADGTDVSWLWDVDLEKLQQIQDKAIRIYTSGIRAEDMAVRLKYEGIPTGKISIVKDYKALINMGLDKTPAGGVFYILPTYTAMLEIRKLLKKMYRLDEFWE